MRLFGEVRSSLPRVLPLFRDPAVPIWLKGLTVLAAALIVSPFDIFGDIPLLGFVDDAALLALLVTGFVTFAGRLRGDVPAQSERRVSPPALPG
jgi:uncharacterized membrane protein YkvA (DUF1232 family)